MVQLLENRLEVQSERIEQSIRGVAARIPTEIALDPASKAHLAQLEEQIIELAKGVLDVKQQVAGIVPPELDLSPVTIQIDDRFEQVNSRWATDLDYLRRDLRRNDQMLLEMQSRLADMPDRNSLRELYTGLMQAIESTVDDGSMVELSDAIAALPERVALRQPIDRLDAAIIQQIDARLEETSERMAQKLEEQLAARVQRFEALSQSMITLAGEPVEALAEKLTQLSKLSDPADELTEAISQLRREGREREALLRHLLAATSPEDSAARDEADAAGAGPAEQD
jgi:chromosome segregation ATPase